MKNTYIIDRLKSFGITKTKFYQYKKERFIYKTLKNTPENRKQIKQMCTKIGITFNSKMYESLLEI